MRKLLRQAVREGARGKLYRHPLVFHKRDGGEKRNEGKEMGKGMKICVSALPKEYKHYALQTHINKREKNETKEIKLVV